MPQTFNFVTDFGALNNGTGTNIVPIRAWRTAAIADPGSTLIIPPGNYNTFENQGIACMNTPNPEHGPSNADVDTPIPFNIIAASGANVSHLSFIGPQGAFANDGSNSALVAEARIGDTSVTLLSSGLASRFTVGGWIAITGIEIQGWGYPINPQRFEFRQITEITGSVISISEPLTQNYSATWPHLSNFDPYTAGPPNYSALHPAFPPEASQDFCGPAKIYALGSAWDVDVYVEGISVTQSSGGNVTGRNIHIKDMDWDPDFICVSPTVALNALYENVYTGDNISNGGATSSEIDKLVDTFEIRGCSGLGFHAQSTSVNHVIVSGGSSISLAGSGRKNTFSNSTFYNLFVGSGGNGRPDSMSCSNVTVTNQYVAYDHLLSRSLFTYVGGGVYSFPTGNLQIYPFIVPGYTYCFGRLGVSTDPDSGPRVDFCVKDLWEEGEATFFSTTITGSEPTPTFGGLSANTFFSYPFQDSVTGSISGADINNPSHGSGGSIPALAPSSCTALIDEVDDPGPVEEARIAYSCDGNASDRDDILSVAMSLALLSKNGMAGQLVHLHHSCHFWGAHSDQNLDPMDDTVRQEEMRISSEETADNFWTGFDTSIFFNDRTQHSTVVSHLTSMINDSTALSPLYIIAAGPMETVGLAIAASNAPARAHVYLVTHSVGNFNDTHSANAITDEEDGFEDLVGYTYSSGITNGTSILTLGINSFPIPNQNVDRFASPGVDWHFLRDSSDVRLRWLWARSRSPQDMTEFVTPIDYGLGSGTMSHWPAGFFDASDAGMVWWLVTGGPDGGDEDGNAAKFQAMFDTDTIHDGFGHLAGKGSLLARPVQRMRAFSRASIISSLTARLSGIDQVILSARVLDGGLSVLADESDKIYICSAEPTTFTEATITFALGVKNFGYIPGAFNDVFTGNTPGRSVASTGFVNGSVTANGIVTHWAVVDSVNSRLLARGPLSVSQSVTNGTTFSIPSFNLRMPGR